MKIKEIMKVLEAEAIIPLKTGSDVKICGGSDLMSDVLFFAKPGSMLLTGLTSLQVIYTASTAGIRAICFVRGKKPPAETIDLAKKKNIALISTRFPMYESCGKLYKKGLPGTSESEEV